MNYKAMETTYKGCRFRSRIEARWAVFFDALKIPWEYEKEGYELSPVLSCDDCNSKEYCDEKDNRSECKYSKHLGFYLPDFWLPKMNAWFEVKGEDTDECTDKLNRLCVLTKKKGYTAIGQIPDPNLIDRDWPINSYDFDIHPWHGDSQYAWCICSKCGKIGIEYCGYIGRDCGHGGDKAAGADDYRLIEAYRAARMARFEHGEKGRKRCN